MLMNVTSLKKECLMLGLDLNKAYKKIELIEKLQEKIYKDRYVHIDSGSLKVRLSTSLPQLSSSFKSLTSRTKNKVMFSDNWIAEPLYSGYRVFIYYSPETSFSIYSARDLGADYIPLNLTMKIPLSRKGKLTNNREHNLLFDKSFLIDVFITSEICEINAKDFIYQDYSRLHTYNYPYKFYMTDVVNFNGEDVKTCSLKERKDILVEIWDMLYDAGFPFYLCSVISEFNEKVFKSLILDGFDGVMFKNLNSTYVPDSRSNKHWVKLKHTYDEDLGITKEAYLTGARFYSSLAHELELSSYFLVGNTKLPVVMGYAQHGDHPFDLDDIKFIEGKNYVLNPEMKDRKVLTNFKNYSESKNIYKECYVIK